jgi:ribonuclease HII
LKPNLRSNDPMWSLEMTHWVKGLSLVAGVDEAGRGALAGPVSVGVVILPPDGLKRDYRDSKTLSAKQRQKLALEIQNEALAWALEFAPASEVDQFGVLEATKRASERAIAKLELQPDALVTDYLKLRLSIPTLAPAKADNNSYNVAAASILAKTARDEFMIRLALEHPEYGFERHKGYGAPIHLRALQDHGAILEHRRSFAPVAMVVEGLFKDLPKV